MALLIIVNPAEVNVVCFIGLPKLALQQKEKKKLPIDERIAD